MKRLFIAEWLIATGIITYRQFKKNHTPPLPGQLIATSVLFVMLAVIADIGDDEARVAALFGGGLDIAAFMNLFGVGGPAAAAGKAPAATTAAPAATAAGG